MPLHAAIQDVVATTPILDTHEHLRLAGEWAPERINLEVICRGYLSWVVPDATAAPGMDLPEWWQRLAPQLPRYRGLAFYRCLLAAFSDLYGLAEDGITGDNWRDLDAAIRAAYRDPGWFRHILLERALIDRSLHDRYWQFGPLPADAGFLLPVLRIDAALYGYNRLARDEDGNSPYSWLDGQGRRLASLDDYLAAVTAMVEQAARQAAPCLKCAVAYGRDLAFERPDFELARAAFDRPPGEERPAEIRAFQSAALYAALDAARGLGLPVQVHTGLARIAGSNPLNLVPVIEDFPDVRFVLFHGGYPWTSEAGALAFTYPNVWLDLNWIPIISPEVACRTLGEWLDLGLGPRVCWGGDCWTAEEAYGATVFARRCIGDVLEQKVTAGAFGPGHAVELARMILRENALELYHLA